MLQNLCPSCTSPVSSYLNYSFYRANSTCTVVEDEFSSEQEPKQAASSAKQEFAQHFKCESSLGEGRVDEEMKRICQKIDQRGYRYKMDATESFKNIQTVGASITKRKETKM